MVAASSSVAADRDNDLPPRQVPRVHPEEPYLHCLPQGVFPEYRPLPLLVQLVTLVVSAAASAAVTWNRVRPLAILQAIASSSTGTSRKQVAFFLVKTLLLAVAARCLLQDLVAFPTRITLPQLRQLYYLPSRLSRVQRLSLLGATSRYQGNVHYLQFDNPNLLPSKTASTDGADDDDNCRLDAIYVNHGFGASSLSWLPALPGLVTRLGAPVGLGHDMVGFGFSERVPEDNDNNDEDTSSSSLYWYSTLASARMAVDLLDSATSFRNQNSSSSVLLMGHSLGAITTLKMALLLPRNMTKQIVLVAPALGLQATPQRTLRRRRPTNLLRPLGHFWRRTLVHPVGGYILKRLVGMPKSWKRGLQVAWGDASRVRESDVLRFQWPAIGKGWELGLLQFGRAQSVLFPGDVSDETTLLDEVLALPNTKVSVIVGSKDRVVTKSMVEKFFAKHQQRVPIVEMEGLGHDPFEEDVPAFLDVVETLLKE